MRLLVAHVVPSFIRLALTRMPELRKSLVGTTLLNLETTLPYLRLYVLMILGVLPTHTQQHLHFHAVEKARVKQKSRDLLRVIFLTPPLKTICTKTLQRMIPSAVLLDLKYPQYHLYSRLKKTIRIA